MDQLSSVAIDEMHRQINIDCLINSSKTNQQCQI